MPVEITEADRDRIIVDHAKAGRPAPSWVAADPKLKALYDRNLPVPAGTVAPAKKAAPKPPAPQKPKAAPAAAKPAPVKAPAKTGGGGRGRHAARSIGRFATAETDRAAATINGKIGTPKVLTRAAGGSAAGGLFLAVFLYPIALAVFQYGPAGFGMWLRAKFLNQTGTSSIDSNGAPLGKRPGGILDHLVPGGGGGSDTGGTGSAGSSSGAGGSGGMTVATPGWAQMMRDRQRVPA